MVIKIKDTGTTVELMPMAKALARKFSKRYGSYGTPMGGQSNVAYNDFLGEAYLSLSEAVASFDAGKGAKIGSWAYTSISQALRRYKDRNASLVSYPDNATGRLALRETPEVLTEVKEWHLSSEDDLTNTGESSNLLLRDFLFDDITYAYTEDGALTTEEYRVMLSRWNKIPYPSIATNMICSEYKVRQLETSAMQKLKDYFNDKYY